MFFFVYKNRFPARQIGPVMAFIPDNISVHVHLLEDKASGDSFEIGDGRILIYSSIGVQNSIF